MDRVDQLAGRGRLRYEPGRTRRPQVIGEDPVAVHRDDEDPRVRGLGSDPADRRQHRDAGHLDIEQQHVGSRRDRLLVRLVVRRSLTDHLHPIGGGEHRPQPFPEELVVIRDDDGHGCRARHVVPLPTNGNVNRMPAAPGALRNSTVAPIAPARSAIPRSPSEVGLRVASS